VGAVLPTRSGGRGVVLRRRYAGDRERLAGRGHPVGRARPRPAAAALRVRLQRVRWRRPRRQRTLRDARHRHDLAARRSRLPHTGGRQHRRLRVRHPPRVLLRSRRDQQPQRVLRAAQVPAPGNRRARRAASLRPFPRSLGVRHTAREPRRAGLLAPGPRPLRAGHLAGSPRGMRAVVRPRLGLRVGGGQRPPGRATRRSPGRQYRPGAHRGRHQRAMRTGNLPRRERRAPQNAAPARSTAATPARPACRNACCRWSHWSARR
jgi:hypothetical protein